MKRILFFYFISICTIHAQNVDKIFTDIENTLKLGCRPISQGTEAYINSQGLLITTFSETDFGIYGKGFFVLLDNENKRIYLTRNGAFHFTDEGFLVNHESYKVLSSRSNISRNEFVFISRNESISRNSFLIVMPILDEFFEITNFEYMELGEFILCDNNHVIKNALESMPIPIDKLLNDLVHCFNNSNISIDEKIEKFEIINNRFYVLFRNNYLVIDLLYKISLALKEIEYMLTPLN